MKLKEIKDIKERMQRVQELCYYKEYKDALELILPCFNYTDMQSSYKEICGSVIVEVLYDDNCLLTNEDVKRLLNYYTRVCTFHPSILHSNLMEYAVNYETVFVNDFWFVDFCMSGVLDCLDDLDYSVAYDVEPLQPSLAERIARKLYREMIHIHNEENAKRFLPFIEKTVSLCDDDNKSLKLYLMQFRYWAGDKDAANNIAKEIVHNVRVMPVTKTSKISDEFYSFEQISETPFHHCSMPTALKAKYWIVKKSLEEKGLSINSIVCNQYCDSYYIDNGNRLYRINCFYNKGGAITRYNVSEKTEEAYSILRIIQDAEPAVLSFYSYKSDIAVLDILHDLLLLNCEELNITISNVVNHKNEYYVKYYLKTSMSYAVLQLHYTNKGVVTKVHPFSSLGIEDKLLLQLLEKVFVPNRPSFLDYFIEDSVSIL